MILLPKMIFYKLSHLSYRGLIRFVWTRPDDLREDLHSVILECFYGLSSMWGNQIISLLIVYVLTELFATSWVNYCNRSGYRFCRMLI